MNLTEELARRVLAALPEPAHPDLLPLLAAGFARELAVIPDPAPGSRRVYIVLGSPLAARPASASDFLPTFLVATRGQEQAEYLCKTGHIAWWSRFCAKGGRYLRPPGPRSQQLVRASTQSLAWEALDGDLPTTVASTPDPDGYGDYEWFNLKGAQPGTIVYRISAKGYLRLFQRLEGVVRIWGYVHLRALSDSVDLHGIVQQLRVDYGPDLVLPPYQAEIPLLAQVPPPRELILVLRSRSYKNKVKRRLRAAARLAAAATSDDT